MPTDYVTQAYPAADLDPELRLALEHLYLAHYDASSPELFQADLRAKDEVIILRYRGEVVGFTTYLVYPFNWLGQEIRVVFSGDTVVRRRHWGQSFLNLGWLASIAGRYRERPDLPWYWFLIVKGHRTYRYLPVCTRRFFPHWQRDEPDLAALAEALACARFGRYYRKRSGLIVFPESRGQLKPEIAEPDQADLRKDSVRFFLQKNPGFRQGHELVCLSPIHENNYRSFIQKLFAREAGTGAPEGPEAAYRRGDGNPHEQS